MFLLTDKPVLVVVNIGEDRVADVEAIAEQFREPGVDDALAACVQLEAEAAMLDADARDELLEGLGLGEGVVPRVARAAYHAARVAARSSPPATRSRARGRSAPGPRRPSARA